MALAELEGLAQVLKESQGQVPPDRLDPRPSVECGLDESAAPSGEPALCVWWPGLCPCKGDTPAKWPALAAIAGPPSTARLPL